MFRSIKANERAFQNPKSSLATIVIVVLATPSTPSLWNPDPMVRPSRGIFGMEGEKDTERRTAISLSGQWHAEEGGGSFSNGWGAPERYLTPQFVLSSFNRGGQWKMIRPVSGRLNWVTQTSHGWFMEAEDNDKIVLCLVYDRLWLGMESMHTWNPKQGKTKRRNERQVLENYPNNTAEPWDQRHGRHLYEASNKHSIPLWATTRKTVRRKAHGSANAVPAGEWSAEARQQGGGALRQGASKRYTFTPARERSHHGRLRNNHRHYGPAGNLHHTLKGAPLGKQVPPRVVLQARTAIVFKHSVPVPL